MPGVGHIQAIPEWVKRKKDDVPCLRANTRQIQNIGQRHARPFRDEGPAFFARLMGDLGSGRKRFQFRKGERRRTCDQTIHHKPPILKVVFSKKLVGLILGWRAIYRDYF